MVHFILLVHSDHIPSGYRMATTQDVENNMEDMYKAMPGWEIANLANGSVQGRSYGRDNAVRGDIRNDVGHELVIYDPNSSSEESQPTPQPTTFQLFKMHEIDMPGNYLVISALHPQAHPEAWGAAKPEWKIANVDDGSMAEASQGGRSRHEFLNEVARQIAKQDPSGPLQFELFGTRDHLPPSYRLATRSEVESRKQELFQAIPGLGSANLADGSVDGASQGGLTSGDTRDDVGHKLAVYDPNSGSRPTTYEMGMPGGFRVISAQAHPVHKPTQGNRQPVTGGGYVGPGETYGAAWMQGG